MLVRFSGRKFPWEVPTTKCPYLNSKTQSVHVCTLLILMAEGAPGKPGMQVLNAATSEKGPLPHELNPHTLNLYALPGCNSTLWTLGGCVHEWVSVCECGCEGVYLFSVCPSHRHTVSRHCVLCAFSSLHIVPLRDRLLLTSGRCHCILLPSWKHTQ